MSEGKKNLIKISFSAFFFAGALNEKRWNLPQDGMVRSPTFACVAQKVGEENKFNCKVFQSLTKISICFSDLAAS